MHDPVTPLSRHQSFCFRCSPAVACFNACCRDLQQVLTPYDIIRLKAFLGISSSEFLQRYIEKSIGPGTGLPVVSLRFGDAADLTCPFVTAAGCRVYPARPASCRTYPLARGVSRDRQTGGLTEHWALIREPHCLGFENGTPQTVDQWVADQEIAVYNQMNDRLLELISEKNRLHPGPLTTSESQRVHTALYDLDAFRAELFAHTVPMDIFQDPADAHRARADDRVLLDAAMTWVRLHVFTTSQEKG